MMKASAASGNAVLAKARALYGRRLRADDYRRLMGCRTMTELAAALKEYPLYADALAEVNPQYARRAQLENLLRQGLYARYDSLCRYDRSAGSKVYEYFTLCCEVDELTAGHALPGCRPPWRLPLPPAGSSCSSAAASTSTRWLKPRAWTASWPLWPTRRGKKSWNR